MDTEQINPRSREIDVLHPGEILRLINDEDSTVAGAVARELPAVEAAVRRVVAAFEAGGRLIYVGAGTSGRLGVLDAAECPPTYGTSPRQVRALLAGGPAAMTASAEDAEDDDAQGAREIAALDVDAHDVVIGIAASGRTPYVIGALRQARQQAAYAVALVANHDCPVADQADLVIAPQTGPEIVAGSTRMKAGTAQKLVLNMISTTAMICTGHTFGNLMIDMQASNSKLRARARAMVIKATGAPEREALDALAEAGGEVKTAIVMLLSGTTAVEARERLARADGVVRRALLAPSHLEV